MVDGFSDHQRQPQESVAEGKGGGILLVLPCSVSVPENVQSEKVGAAYENWRASR